jgi:CHASE3 domain-containing protein
VSDSFSARRTATVGVLQECSFAHVHAPHSAVEAPAEVEPGLAASSAPPVQLAPAADTFAVAAPLVHETVEFRRLLTRAFLVPAILLALLAVALGSGVALLVRQARLTQRSDQVLAHSARLRELLVDRETSLRGYLLSGDRTFLGPLERADARLVDTEQRLRVLLRADPDQRARLEIVERMAREWAQYAEHERVLFESGEDYIRHFKAGEGVQRLSSMLEVRERAVTPARARRARRAHR